MVSSRGKFRGVSRFIGREKRGFVSARVAISIGGRGNSGRGTSHSATQGRLNSLPKVLSELFNGWIEITEATPYEVVLKDQCNEL